MCIPNLARNLKKHMSIMFIITKFGENFEDKFISASFKMFGTEKWKLKSLTNGWDFYPDPTNNEN